MAKRVFFRKIYTKKKFKKFLRWLPKFLLVFGGAFVFGILSAGFLFVYYTKDLPRPEKFTEREFIESTKIYDRTGETILYELYAEEKREIVPLNEISSYLKYAAISAEDAKFYSHHGIDLEGIFRAIKINLKIGKPLYGGSTISQQLIRSTFLSQEKTIKRKIREIVLTLELERKYSKDQILEWYLNQIPFGPNIYGVEAASKTYFNKSSKDLSLSEAASLAAMIRSPSYYYNHLDELKTRRDYVLDRMKEEGYISSKEAERAKNQELQIADIFKPLIAPHFVLYVKDYLIKKYGEEFLKKGGLHVYTTIDLELQKEAEKIVKEGVERNKAYNAYNAALVAINPKNGEIISMVGSADWYADPLPKGCASGVNCLFDPKVNAAAYGIGRQPGSAFKPFVYATAFQKRVCDDKTIVIDEPTDFGVWGGKHYIPTNYDGLYRGPVTIRQALSNSLNIPSVKVLVNYAGIKDSVENAKKFGITTLKESSFYGPAIVLGGGEVRLLDMVSAYGVFATEGLRIPPSPIIKITDSKGNIIEENHPSSRRVLDEYSARLISDILSDNNARAPMFGYNSPLYIPNYQVAVKTGTTSDYRDAWTIGYTPSISVGVWVGNNDNTPIAKKPGVMVAAPIWHQFMVKALRKFPKEYFTPPSLNKIFDKEEIIKEINKKETETNLIEDENKTENSSER